MGNNAISNQMVIRNTDAVAATQAEGGATAKKPSVFSKVASNLANAMNNSMKYVQNNKLALITGVLSAALINPLVGLAIFAAISVAKRYLDAPTNKPSVQKAEVNDQTTPLASPA